MNRLLSLIFLSSCLVMGTDVKEKLLSAQVFEDVGIDVEDNDTLDELTVEFNREKIIPGQQLTLEEVANQPQVFFPDASEQNLYTILMVDPDAPSREDPIRRSYLHWMLINIQGKGVNVGENKCPFVPSSPPPNTGFHRYVFLLFKQPLYFSNIDECSNRAGFNTTDFVIEHGLDLVAANYYEASRDPLEQAQDES